MSNKNHDEEKPMAFSDAGASGAWSDVPAEVIPFNTSFGVDLDEDNTADVSDADIEYALNFGVGASDYLAAKSMGAAMIKRWIAVASTSGQNLDVSTNDKQLNSETSKVEPPVVTTTGRSSVVKLPPPKEGIEAITTMLAILTKRTEALDAQREEQIRQEKLSNAELTQKLQQSEKVLAELQSSKINVVLERDQANLRHKNATLALEQAATSRKLELELAEQSRKSLEDQLLAAKESIQIEKASHEAAIKQANEKANQKAWVIAIVASVIIVATIVVLKFFQ